MTLHAPLPKKEKVHIYKKSKHIQKCINFFFCDILKKSFQPFKTQKTKKPPIFQQNESWPVQFPSVVAQ